MEPWWLVCILEGVFTGQPLAIFRNQLSGMSEHHSGVVNVTNRQVILCPVQPWSHQPCHTVLWVPIRL